MASADLEIATDLVGKEEETQAEPEASSSSTSLSLSKNAQKKAAKATRFAAQKLERRAKEKEVKKAKKRIRAQKRAAGELEEDELQEDEEKKRAMKRAKTGAGQKHFAARVCIDLGFDDMMSDKEVISLCSQLGYVYSANRRSTCPFKSVLFTSVNGRTFARLETQNDGAYKRWTGTEWWQDGYEQLWVDEPATPMEGHGEGTEAESKTTRESVIYLTADSDEELMELKEGETYVIGGICDHNRYTRLCLNKAVESGIRTAKLPIGRFLSLTTRKILTVNQAFEILVKWVETRDWEKALYTVIPKRKFDKESEGNGDGEEPQDDDAVQDDTGKLKDPEATTEVAEAEGPGREKKAM